MALSILIIQISASAGVAQRRGKLLLSEDAEEEDEDEDEDLDATMVNSMSLVRLRVSRAPRSGIAPFKLPLPSDWLVK